MEERLQKFISSSGYCSRREAERLIAEGYVSVNGKVVRELGTKVSESDTVMIGDSTIKPEPARFLVGTARQKSDMRQ